MKICVFILAGGKGERFWPKSRQNLPKQFLSLTSDGKSMLQHTVDRTISMTNIEDIFVVTNKNYTEIVQKQIPELPLANIIGEPIGRNTAPGVALSAAIAAKKYKDAVMLVLPADHMIADEKSYIKTLKIGIEQAIKEKCLVTFGISPSYPETGYGYIKFDKNSVVDNVCKVEKFVEKPNLEKAQNYLNDGCYLWNSGMFVWQASVILDRFQVLMPDVYEIAMKIVEKYHTNEFENKLEENFTKMPSESVDYGIIEKSDNIYTVISSFGWDDVGSWTATGRINPCDENGNVVNGEWVGLDTKNCLIFSTEKKLVATIGVEDIIIVDTPDALLVCIKDKAQDVKNILAQLKKENKNNYL